MATKQYHLFDSTATTADNKVSTKITRKGSITAICFSVSGISGAAVDGRSRWELSKQSSSAFNQNDKPSTVLCTIVGGTVGVATSGIGSNTLLAGISIPVDVGDTIYLHQECSGTANGTLNKNVSISVDE